MSFDIVAASDAPNDTVNTASNQRRGTFGQSELALAQKGHTQHLEQLSKTHSLRKVIDKRVEKLQEKQRKTHEKNMKRPYFFLSRDPQVLELYILQYMDQKGNDHDIREMLVYIGKESELDDYILDKEERTQMVNDLRSKVDKVARGNSCTIS